jgi:deoxycytidine triphosphate deaminase
VLIRPLDPEQLEDESDAHASYDLRVGERYRLHGWNNSRSLADDGVIKLRPGQAAIVQTEEVVRLPTQRFGVIWTKVSLLQEGVANIVSKVDPGYDGNLAVTVFNLGRKTVTLRRRQRFCGLGIFDVASGGGIYTKGPKSLESEVGLRIRERLQEFAYAMTPWMNLLLVVVTLLSVATAIVALSQTVR